MTTWPRRLLNTGQFAARASYERRIPYWPIERVQQLQSRRFQATVRHAYATVPYYRRTMDELGLRPGDFETVADLTKLPLVDAATVRQDPDQFASTDYDESSRRISRSGGTETYVRKKIYWDTASDLRRLAFAERSRVVLFKLAGQRWGRRELYIFSPTGAIPKAQSRFKSQTWGSRRLVERHTFSADEPFEALVAKLNAFQPQIAFSYGSHAEHFFRYLIDGGVITAVPRVWRYTGDPLSSGGKELIERTFGCTVNSTYSSVETGPIGFQCELCQGFHLDIDLNAVRIIDETGQDVPAGEDGEIVVSNLHNRAMVLLNYRIGDLGALATEPCSCGRTLPLLDRFQGRRGELIALADGRVLPSLLVGSLFFNELESALKSQIVHPAPGHIRWRIVPFAGVDQDAMRNALLIRGREVLGEGTRAEVEFVADIPSSRIGKFRRVVRDTDLPLDAEAER